MKVLQESIPHKIFESMETKQIEGTNYSAALQSKNNEHDSEILEAAKADKKATQQTSASAMGERKKEVAVLKVLGNGPNLRKTCSFYNIIVKTPVKCCQQGITTILMLVSLCGRHYNYAWSTKHAKTTTISQATMAVH